MSSIMKGIVDESENVSVIYIDGKAAVKYANKYEAEKDAARMRERFPNKKIEIKQEVRETELDENLHKWFKEKWVRFGPDGKIRGACARGDDSEGKPKCLPQSKAHSIGKKGRKYAASKKRREDPNPERRGPAKNVATKKKTNESIPFDQCPDCGGEIVHESMMNEKQDACYHKVKARYKVWPSAYASGALVQCRKKGASNWGNKSKANEGVIIGHDATDPDVAVLGGAGSYKLSNLKRKAQMEATELAKDIASGKFKNSAYNIKQLANTLNTIVAAEEEMEKLYFGEDYTGEYAAEKTPAINPYGGLKDIQHRGAISETPTDNPTGASGEGGWRKYKPKSAGEIDEAKKSEFRQRVEQQQIEKLEKIAKSSLPHWAKEYLTLLNDPKGKVFKAGYHSFPKGQDAREEAAQYIMNKYKVPQHMIDKVKHGEMAHMAMDRPDDRNYDFDVPSVHEDTAYAGGMGQGHSGESYRKFKPKSAGTFKEEDELDEACWKGYHKEGMKTMFGKKYPNCVKNSNESAILKGINSKRK